VSPIITLAVAFAIIILVTAASTYVFDRYFTGEMEEEK